MGGTRCTPKPKKQKGKAASAAVTDTLIRHLFAEQQQPQAEQSRTLIFWFFFLPYTYLLLRNIPHLIVVFCFVRMSCFQLNLSLLYILRCDTHDSTHLLLFAVTAVNTQVGARGAEMLENRGIAVDSRDAYVRC